MLGRISIYSVALALLAVVAGAVAAPYELLGYQEGSSKTVQCKAGGYFNGIELSFASLSGFSEKVATGLRLWCSTGALIVQYLGEVPDSQHAFGSNYNPSAVMSAACPAGKGLAGIAWRRGELSGKDEQAWKPAGLEVYCGTETMNPTKLDAAPNKIYPLGGVLCSKTERPPENISERRAVEVEVWEEVEWVGLRIVRCEAAPS